MSAQCSGRGVSGLETPWEEHPGPADPIAVASYRSRLAVTAHGQLTHIAQPSRFRLTMCGAYRMVEFFLENGGDLRWRCPPVPEGQRVCSRCLAAYEREVSGG